MTFGTARDLSSQVVAIPMTSFGMLMNSPHSEFQKISPQKRACVAQCPCGRQTGRNPFHPSRGPLAAILRQDSLAFSSASIIFDHRGHQAIPQHGCVPAEPASVSPGKIILAPPCPSVSTSG
jgi:hypothetical protein